MTKAFVHPVIIGVLSLFFRRCHVPLLHVDLEYLHVVVSPAGHDGVFVAPVAAQDSVRVSRQVEEGSPGGSNIPHLEEGVV